MDIEQDLRIFENPADILFLTAVRNKIFRKVKELDVTVSESMEPLSYEDRAAGYRIIKKGSLWGKAFSCAWFHLTGSIPEDVRDKKLCVVFDICAEGLIYDAEGKPAAGISNPISIMSVAEFFNPPGGKTFMLLDDNCKDIDLWVDAGYNGVQGYEAGRGMLKKSSLCIFDSEVYNLYFDFLAVMLLKVNQSGGEKKNTEKLLYKSYKYFLKGNIEQARNILAPVLNRHSDSRLNITAVGHSHLDLAWLWPIRETKRKAARTLSNALYNMEHYPGYIYGASQPQEFTWVKKDYPSVYERILTAYKNGRFEPQGGMWVECDTNIPSGESLIRQFYYGKKFWKEEFGEDVKNCWLPDVFGYTASLPQIMKKCGVDFFMTQKLSWNEHNEFPLETFYWEGLSDDRVLTHLLPGNNYNSSGFAPSLKELSDNHRRKDITDRALMLYGAGDGGGGPCQANIEMIKRFSDAEGLPKIHFGKASDFFSELQKDNYRLPSHKGELYLEKHQGTYTTQSNTKKNNHLCEKQMHNLEVLGTAAMLAGHGYDYKKAENLWKEILLYQFHDILPGSAINRVYKESNERYKIILDDINGLKKNAEAFIKKSDKKTGINFTSFERKGYVKSDGEWYKYKLSPYSAGKLFKAEDDFSCMKSNGIKMESDRFIIMLSEYGDIASCTDKSDGTEFSDGSLNSLNLYKDKKLYYNAWDIDINYVKNAPEKLHRTSYRFYTDGPDAVTENYYSFGSSDMVQKVILRKNLPYIIFETCIDWHETHKMLRAEFFPCIYSDSVTCDIQFGNIERSTLQKTKKDWAQFEICAHKYADVSSLTAGTAILSDGKYGFRVKDGLISMNLLRSPVYPDKTADRGFHRFRYAYCPHMKNCFDGSVPEYAYDFNNEIMVSHAEFSSLIKTDKRNIICETVKPSENGRGIVLRIYENEGIKTDTVLSIGFVYKKLYETDMLENIIAPSDRKLSFRAYEIKTLYLEL